MRAFRIVTDKAARQSPATGLASGSPAMTPTSADARTAGEATAISSGVAVAPRRRSRGRMDIPGTHNFRCTGGYPAARGRTRPDWLYRSDVLSRVPAEGLALIMQLGIARVVDLRSNIECRSNGPVQLPGAEVFNVSIYGGSHHSMAVAAAGDLSLERLYRNTLIDSGCQIAEAVGLVAESPGPVLVHCTAGKDRTGLVVALILACVGVRRSVIVADYTESALNLDGPWMEQAVSELVSRGMPISGKLYQVIGGSPARTMERVLDWVVAAYGSVPEYLCEHGLPSHLVTRLQAALVVSDSEHGGRGQEAQA